MNTFFYSFLQDSQALESENSRDFEREVVESESGEEGVRRRRRFRRRNLNLQHWRRLHRDLHRHRPRHHHPHLRVLVNDHILPIFRLKQGYHAS